MNYDIIVTCAVTGAGDTVGKHPAIPVTPKEIAAAAIEAAKAGATVAHCHVRDPKTGKGSRDVALYREVVERIREADTDVIINLTAGMGGDLEIGAAENPMQFGSGTDLVGPLTRLAHVEALLPEICTLDCGSLNFGDGDLIYVSTPAMQRRLLPAMNTCEAISRRQEELSGRVARNSQLLRTRVDIELERQNQELLGQMNQRAKLQLRLQETVEGLSVVVLTYYGSQLVQYLAKGTKEFHHFNTDIITAISIPIIAGLVAWGTRRMRKKLASEAGESSH